MYAQEDTTVNISYCTEGVILNSRVNEPLAKMSACEKIRPNTVVAYLLAWAIGTGKRSKPHTHESSEKKICMSVNTLRF